MEKKQIGLFTVNPIGIGTWGMGGDRHEDGTIYADYRFDDRDINAIGYALEKGQNHIDTAQLYGAGHTEEIVGEAIQDHKRNDIFLASKIWSSHLLRVSVVRCVEDMLRRLKTDYLDLLYVHAPFEAVPMSEYLTGMNDALERGLVRSLGVSNFALEQLKEAVALSNAPIVANQVLYNIINHGPVTADLLEYCLANGIAVIAYRPVERKLLAEKAQNQKVIDIARKYVRPVSQIAINWLIGQPGVVTIPKASTTGHVDENLKALDFELESQDRMLLDGVAQKEILI